MTAHITLIVARRTLFSAGLQDSSLQRQDFCSEKISIFKRDKEISGLSKLVFLCDSLT
jgi:hypothetical protein